MAEWKVPKTNWEKKDPVGMADMNRIEENASYLYEKANGAKSLLIAALRSMDSIITDAANFLGISISIREISDSVSAQPNQVMKGKTFYAGGEKMTGTLEAEVLE